MVRAGRQPVAHPAGAAAWLWRGCGCGGWCGCGDKMGGGLRGGVQSCYCLPSVNTHTPSTMADTEPTTVEEVQVS